MFSCSQVKFSNWYNFYNSLDNQLLIKKIIDVFYEALYIYLQFIKTLCGVEFKISS